MTDPSAKDKHAIADMFAMHPAAAQALYDRIRNRADHAKANLLYASLEGKVNVIQHHAGELDNAQRILAELDEIIAAMPDVTA